MSTPGGTPAGWYDDGTGTSTMRYWDGVRWTEDTRPGGAGWSGQGQVPAQRGAAYGAQGDPYGTGTGSTAPYKAGTHYGAGVSYGTSTTPYGATGSPYAQAAPGATRVHPLGWTALALAVVGLVFACIPGALIVGWILLPVAFVLAVVTFFLQGKKWPAITALVVSVVGTILGVIVFFVVVGDTAKDAFDTTEATAPVAPDDAEPAPEDEGTAAEEEPAEEEPAEETDEPAPGDDAVTEGAVPLGTPVVGEEYEVTINSVNPDATDEVLAANSFNEEPRDGYVYAVANATITYTGAETGIAVFAGIDYVTSDGVTVTWAESALVAPEPMIGIDELAPGDSATGNFAFEIPEGDVGVFRVTPGLMSDETLVATK